MKNKENTTVETQNASEGWKILAILVVVIALGNIIGILAAQRLS